MKNQCMTEERINTNLTLSQIVSFIRMLTCQPKVEEVQRKSSSMRERTIKLNQITMPCATVPRSARRSHRVTATHVTPTWQPTCHRGQHHVTRVRGRVLKCCLIPTTQHSDHSVVPVVCGHVYFNYQVLSVQRVNEHGFVCTTWSLIWRPVSIKGSRLQLIWLLSGWLFV